MIPLVGTIILLPLALIGLAVVVVRFAAAAVRALAESMASRLFAAR